MIPDGYKMQYTWFMDFRIADAFGENAIRDTYKRAFREWKSNVDAMKELTYCLNIKCWDFYHHGNDKLRELYAELYHDCYGKCLDNFKDEELREYWSFLD